MEKLIKGSQKWAFKMLANGERIKCKNWVDHWFIYLDKTSGHIRDARGAIYSSCHFPKSGWEIYDFDKACEQNNKTKD